MKTIGTLIGTAAVGLLMKSVSSAISQHKSTFVREIEDGTRKNVGRFVKAFKEGYHSGFEK